MFQKALDDLQVYVKRAPDDADGYRERAIAKYGLGDKSGALADLEIAHNNYAKAGDTAAADQSRGAVESDARRYSAARTLAT